MNEVVHVVTVMNVDISTIKGSGAFILEYATKPTVKVYADAKSAADYARERIEAVEKLPDLFENLIREADNTIRKVKAQTLNARHLAQALSENSGSDSRK